MQVNNRRLRDYFHKNKPYSAENRAVEIENNSDGDSVVYARLYKTRIVRKNLSTGKMAVCSGGWNTITTTKAINACLPDGWKVARAHLITPNNNHIELKSNTWIELEEPEWFKKYVKPIY